MPAELPASPTLDLTRPGIIEASAGTGKTYTIAEIFLALLKGEKTFPHALAATEKTTPASVREILVVTFTEAATAELRDRLSAKIRDALADGNSLPDDVKTALQLASAEFDEAAISTINGFCLRMLREYGIDSARLDSVDNPEQDELPRFAARWRERKIAGGAKEFFKVPAEKIAAVIGVKIKNPDLVPVDPNDMEHENDSDFSASALYLAATEAFDEWRAQRANAHEISHTETLTVLRDALRENDALAKKISERFRFAIVDEFQDTDPVQWEIFKRIFFKNKRPIFCVGDPKQAIYEFRGGDIRTYRAARADLRAAGKGNTLRLDKNWRSRPETIAAFNEIFAADKDIGTGINVGNKSAPRFIDANFSGNLEYCPTAFPPEKFAEEKISDDEKNTPAIVLKYTDDETNKEVAEKKIAAEIASDIAELVNFRGVPAHEIAVLISQNDEAEMFRRLLAEKKIPVSTTARGNVLCEPIARDFSDLLHATLNPRDLPLFRRVLISPFFAGTKNALLFADDDAENSSEEIENIRTVFVATRDRWFRSGFLSAFAGLFSALDFFKNIATLPNARRLITDILHIEEIIREEERRRKLSPRALAEAFDDKLADAAPKDDSDELKVRVDDDADAVRILTVHKSKGLEFEIVFLPSLWQRNFLKREIPRFTKSGSDDVATRLIFAPAKKENASDEFLLAMLENAATSEACTFYVALTRARRRVVLYHARQSEKNCRSVWDSYQLRILGASKIFTSQETPAPLPHWVKLPLGAPLPEKIFPKKKNEKSENARAGETLFSDDAARERFETAERTRAKLLGEIEGVFSFSSLMRAAESDDFSRNDDEGSDGAQPALQANSGANDDPENATENSFPRTNFFALPSGTEFGTLVHSVFEKTDFNSRENLDALLDETVPLLPNAENESLIDRKKKAAEMVERCLALPLTRTGFRLETLDKKKFVREMEFHFPLKRSRALYTELAAIFKRWGGIYAETAERHWRGDESDSAHKLNIGGMMTGVIDLAFEADGKFYVLDWKTNRVTDAETLTESALREEIVRHGYALQWSIYALALREFLQKSLGKNYVHDRDFGGIVYLFVRWLAPFIDTETLTSARLDELAETLLKSPTA